MKVTLFPPIVGPIIGHVSHSDARIFVSGGGKQRTRFDVEKARAVIRIKERGNEETMHMCVKPLNPNFDLSYVFVFQGLKPNSAYEFEVGLFSEKHTSPQGVGSFSECDFIWSRAARGCLKTDSEEGGSQKQSRFFFGSCRYLLKLFGGTWFDNRGDKCFASLLRSYQEKEDNAHVLMIGDQIYADDLHCLGAAATLDDFYDRYRDAFGQPHIAQLFAQMPCYFAFDDHELEDNWPKSATQKDFKTKYPVAVHSLLTYQLSHSPLFAVSNGKITGRPSHFWYAFFRNGNGFFVMDTRTERFLSPGKQEIISPEQLQSLFDWLQANKGKNLFIVTGVPMFPDIPHNDDKWGGFPEQRLKILDYIFDHEIPRVTFLSGDVHCALSAELSCQTKPNTRVRSIISSPFFWPYPIARTAPASESDIKGKKRSYQVEVQTPICHEDNYTCVELSENDLRVTVYTRKGEEFHTINFKQEGFSLQHVEAI